MRAIIKKGRIILPREILKKLHFPENGECEIVIEEGVLKLFYPAKSPESWVRFFKEPPIESTIEEFVKAEVVNED